MLTPNLNIIFFFTIWFNQRCLAVRPQIGFYPLKGNMYRAKPDGTIDGKMSKEWQKFLDKSDLAITVSEATNITYWIGDSENAYPNSETEQDLCIHTLDPILNPSSSLPERKLQMYFVCDAYCCADECCEKDWLLTFVGGICIFFFALIPAFCLISCFITYIQNSRNRYPTFKNNNNCIEYKGVTS